MRRIGVLMGQASDDPVAQARNSQGEQNACRDQDLIHMPRKVLQTLCWRKSLGGSTSTQDR
jgi:hypothetical protein